MAPSELYKCKCRSQTVCFFISVYFFWPPSADFASQLMTLPVSWWRSKSADGGQSQLMEVKVSLWRSKEVNWYKKVNCIKRLIVSSDCQIFQIMNVLRINGDGPHFLILICRVFAMFAITGFRVKGQCCRKMASHCNFKVICNKKNLF